jgi:hypothetical protein
MDTNDLKRLIGSDCLVIDPRSKKKVFEPAKIISANFSISKGRTEELYEHISFGVVLDKITIKKNRFRENIEYHRSFNVSGERIQIPS